MGPASGNRKAAAGRRKPSDEGSCELENCQFCSSGSGRTNGHCVRRNGAGSCRGRPDGYGRTMAGVVLVPLEDYNAATGEERSLDPDQILFFVNKKGMDGRKKVSLAGREWKVAEELPELFAESKVSEPMIKTYYLIMDSVETVKSIQRETTKEEMLTYQKSYNLSGSSEKFEDAENQLGIRMNGAVSDLAYVYVDGRQLNRASFYSLYGSLFFLGILLGLLFLMAVRPRGTMTVKNLKLCRRWV